MKRPSFINILTIIILIAFVIKQGPSILNNFSQTGKLLSPQEYKVLSEGSQETLLFPQEKEKKILLFWATWCGPCKIEMARLKSSVESGKISSSDILAVNPFEGEIEIKKFLRQNSFPFVFIEARDLARNLQVELTPTTAFVKDQNVVRMSSGMSLIGIWRAELFLAP